MHQQSIVQQAPKERPYLPTTSLSAEDVESPQKGVTVNTDVDGLGMRNPGAEIGGQIPLRGREDVGDLVLRRVIRNAILGIHSDRGALVRVSGRRDAASVLLVILFVRVRRGPSEEDVDPATRVKQLRRLLEGVVIGRGLESQLVAQGCVVWVASLLHRKFRHPGNTHPDCWGVDPRNCRTV